MLIMGGGVIPEEDVPFLKEHGISEVFGPGTPLATIVEYIKTHVTREA